MSQTSKISISYALGNIKLRPGEQVIGFEIEVSGGGFESISTLPRGWRIAIDNKSLSRTTMNADLAFGSEVLTEAGLGSIIVTLTQIELDGQDFRVTGHLLVTNGGSEHRVSLSKPNFVLRPAAAKP